MRRREKRMHGLRQIPGNGPAARASGWRAATLAVLAIGAWLAWGPAPGGLAASQAGAFPVCITDQAGHRLELARQPQRIVSLAPNNTEILFAVGAGPQVVGVTNYCDYPAEAKTRTRVGDLNLNWETILSLHPDLLVANASLEPQHIQRAEQLHLPVLVLNPVDLNSTLEAIRIVGEATGHAPQAAALVKSLQKRISRVQALAAQDLEKRHGVRPKVFVEIWNDPLMTAGPGSFPDEIIRLAGGQNIAADAKAPWPQYSAEQVISHDPDVILLTNNNRDEVMARPAWKTIRAVRLGQVYAVNPAWLSRPGPRLVNALEEIQNLLARSK